MNKRYRLEWENKPGEPMEHICYLAWTNAEGKLICGFTGNSCGGLLFERPKDCPLVEVK